MKNLNAKAIALSLFICLAGFIIFVYLSFQNYPGGNNFDPTAVGHSFWMNFWCDVMADRTLNNVPNTARPFAVAAAFCLVAGLFILGLNSYRFTLFSKLTYRIMLSLGILSILTAPGVNYYHDTFLMITATSGLTAFLMFLFATYKSNNKLFTLFGVLAFLTGLLNFILWLQVHQTIFLPVIQKISTIFLFLWMLTGSLILFKNQR